MVTPIYYTPPEPPPWQDDERLKNSNREWLQFVAAIVFLACMFAVLWLAVSFAGPVTK